MKNEEPREPTREEVVERWRRRQEQEQREPWRVFKRAKARDEQRMIIVPTLSSRLWRIVMLAIGACVGVTTVVYFRSIPFWGVLLLLLGSVFLLLGQTLIGKKIVIDKPSESIILEARSFLSFHGRRVIPFSSVISVVVHNTATPRSAGRPGISESCTVSLNTGGEMVQIDSMSNLGDGFDLGTAVSKFIGKGLKVTSSGHWPESDIFLKKTFDIDRLPPFPKL